MKLRTIAIFFMLPLFSVMSTSAIAKGCIKGVVAGAVTGHYAGIGAVGGCAVGRHLANMKAAEQKAKSTTATQPTASAK